MKKNNLLYFFRFMKEAKKEYIVGITCTTIAIFVEIYTTKLISRLFSQDSIMHIDKAAAFNFALKIALYYVILKVIEILSRDKVRYLLTKASNTVYIFIQKLIYDHIQSLPIKYFDNLPAGSILSKITSDVSIIKQFFSYTLIDFLTVILKLVFMFGILMFLNLKLTLVLMIALPTLILSQVLYKDILYKLTSKYRKHNSTSLGLANEICQNLEVIKAFNMEQNSLNDWEEEVKRRYMINKKISLLESLMLHNLNYIISLILQLIVISYYLYGELNGIHSIGSADVFIFLTYIGSITYEITVMFENISIYSNALGATKNLGDILEMEPEHSGTLNMVEDFKADIHFNNLWFSYDSDKYILKDINLDIKENETVAIIGHTGSGKSSLINLIIKFYNYQKGHLYISGKELKEYDNEYIRSKIAIVMQDSFLFEGTILSNISDDRAKAEAALKKLGAEYLLEERGLDGIVEIDGNNFSTGEKQLICFARALAKDPKILILDEATSNIDSKTEQIIQHGIEILKENRTTIIIAHRLSTIRNSNKICVLDKGEIIELGNHFELLVQNGVYKKMIDNDNSYYN